MWLLRIRGLPGYRRVASRTVLWCAGSNSLSTSRSEPSLPPNSGGQPALTEGRQFELLSNEIRDLRSQLLQRAAVTYPSAQVGDLSSLLEGRPTLTTHDGPTLSTEVARHDEEDSSKVAAIRLGCSIITTVAAAMCLTVCDDDDGDGGGGGVSAGGCGRRSSAARTGR